MNEALRYVSTAQVAAALGVSVSTVKRWVDEDVLPARRTAGGHRKLLRDDVLRLIRENDFPHADLAKLGLVQGSNGHGEPANLLPRLYKGLRTGDAAAVRALVLSVYRSGVPLETLGDEVVAPALTRIGADWESGAIEVMHEHRATQICAAALYELRGELETGGERNRPVAVGGSPEWDPTVVPSLLAQMTLTDLGWEAVNLGPYTPVASFRRALQEYRPRLLWISMTHPPQGTEQFAADYDALIHEARRLNVAVMIGGRGMSEWLRGALEYTAFGQRLSHLVAFAQTIYRRPPRPKRGRPRSAAG